MKTHLDLSDSQLLQSMLAGDEDALAALYRRRSPGIYRFALQMCGSQALAEDVTQEVFMVLMREGYVFDPARGSLNAFLLGVARNHVLRRLRRERFYVAMEEDADNGQKTSLAGPTSATLAGPLDQLARTEAIESVRRSVLALPERYREVVVLCDLQEMSYAEAAEILGCAVGTIRSRLHRARGLLIAKLRPEDETEMVQANTKSARCFA